MPCLRAGSLSPFSAVPTAAEAVVQRRSPSLADLGRGSGGRRLLALLEKPPGVSGPSIVALLDAFGHLGLPLPPLDDLVAIDNLHSSERAALRCR